ncbi:MAG TPA: DUF5916 domain-containing protein [Planctomycetaceae bacterium]|nr:DUF5916 domain-containing protein [Planctomycetaceae bacterium]
MDTSKRLGLPVVFAVALFTLFAAPAHAQPAARPRVTVVRTAQPPLINGRLDDEVWRTSAARLDTFVQERPVEGAPATERTEVLLAYDSERLYIGIYAHYADASAIRANRVDRDKTEEDDIVTITFDPFLDQQLGYSFSVNGYGVQGDSVIKPQAGPGGNSAASNGATGDVTWNALFSSSGQLVDDGWTAEMAIPFKSLRYPARGNGQPHRWGFQIERQIRTKNEVVDWAPISRSVSGFMRQMGTLDGMTNLSTSRNLELLPTFTAISSGALSPATGEFVTLHDEQGGVGFKYGLTPNLTLDFTYNPDFSTIESDTQQIEINQRFPIQYPELRPFFLEGYDNIRVGGPATFLHTRTIVDPQWGAKVTGKVGKTTLGFLVANDEAPGKVADASDPAYNKEAQVAIGRVRYDYRPESSVGTLFTNREFLNSYSRMIGLDTPLRFGGGKYLIRYTGFYSDRRAVSGKRSTGNMYEILFRQDGRHLTYSLVNYQFSPEYGTDLGFVRRVDQRVTNGRAAYRWYPETWIKSWGPDFTYDRNYDYSGTLQNAGPSGGATFQFARNMNLTTSVSHDLERYREIDFVKNRFTISGGVNTVRWISFTGSYSSGDEIRFTANPYLGGSAVYSVSTTLRPVSRFQSVIKLSTSSFNDVRTDTKAFDVTVFRAQTTYQFTPRLLIRNITEFNSGLGSNHTMFQNFLVTYRVNSGTAFYVGYDDRYRHGDAINPAIFPDAAYQRTSRAIFTKLQYLFRNGNN